MGTGQGKEGMVRANAVHNGGIGVGPMISEGDSSGLAGLIAEQWQTLVELLNALIP